MLFANISSNKVPFPGLKEILKQMEETHLREHELEQDNLADEFEKEIKNVNDKDM